MKHKSTNLRLKAAIVMSGMTMTELAKKVGMAKGVLSRKINGLLRFNEAEMYVISQELNVPVTDIFFGSEVHKTITNRQKGA